MSDMNYSLQSPQNETITQLEPIYTRLQKCLRAAPSSTVPEGVLLEIIRIEAPTCTPDTLFTIISDLFSSVRKLTYQSDVIYSGVELKMSSLQNLADEWESDHDKPVFNSSPGAEQSRWSLVMATVDFHKWVLYCSEQDIREVMVYRNMSWKVWSGENAIRHELFQHTTPYLTNYNDFKKILHNVQSANICTGIPRVLTSPKRRRGNAQYSEECEHIVLGSTQSVCHACCASAEQNELNSEVLELDGKVTKVTDSIESLQEIIHGVKVELEQLRRDHCAIMQYLLHLPHFPFQQTAPHKVNNFNFTNNQKLRSSVYPFCSTSTMENSPDELVNSIALAIQNRGPGNPLTASQAILDNRVDKTGAKNEFNDIMHFGEDISIAKSQLYSIITKARNCAHPQTKLITMLVKNLIPEYEGKSYTRLDPTHTNILRSLYFTVFPVEVDENVVEDDMRARIKSRIEEEIWQKLKVTITDCCRKAKPKTAPPSSYSYPTHVSIPTISAAGSARSLSPCLTQAINSHIFSTLSHQTFNTATTLAMSAPTSMINTIKSEANHI